MKSTFLAAKRTQVGATLMEVLVSILILSVGLLGSAGLMVNSMRNVSEQGNSVAASVYARELAERMMANRGEALKPTASNPYIFDTTNGPWPTSSVKCDTSVCSTAQRAAWDTSDWAFRIRNSGSTGVGSIPGVNVRVCYDSLTANGGTANQWSCNPGTGATLVIKIAWASRDAAGNVENTSPSNPVPRATFVVSPGARS